MAFKKQCYNTNKETAKIATVEPIKKVEDIQRIIGWFYEHDLEKYAILFYFGCLTGLRAGDILSFRVKDLYKKEKVQLREQKTGKVKFFPLREELRVLIDRYIEKNNLDEDAYVFGGRGNAELDRSQVYRFINKACEELGIVDNVGTHTMRKTFGYHAYRQGTKIAVLMNIFNHASPDVTLRYIGVTQDEQDEVYMNLNLKTPQIKKDLNDLAAEVVGSNKTRLKKVVALCSKYLKDTHNTGTFAPMAFMILDIIKSVPAYKYFDKKTGKYRS